MLVYRIAKEKYINEISGEGARIYPGRWNSKNTPVLYTSESLALAAWEMAVRLDPVNFPEGLSYAVIKIPDDSISMVKDLPKGNSLKVQMETLRIGKEFILKGKYIALKVPSIVVPQSYNYVLNPNHKEYSKVELIKAENFKYDERLKIW